MSVLHSRITSEDYLKTPDYHPVGTEQTPMLTPVGLVSYQNETVLYGTAEPLITADGAVVPAAADVTYPDVIPAGRH